MWLLLATIVITDPYKGIDYKTNSYEIEREYLEDVIHITSADSSAEPKLSDEEEDQYEEDEEDQYEEDEEDQYEEDEEDQYGDGEEVQKNLNILFPYIFPKNLP